MSDSGEETYSTMFASLKHPARRRILRMLDEKPKNFSRILEELGISSSHLTYHLENLGELVSKLDDGRYRLSSFGKAAVLTMKGVEEAPEVHPKSVFALPKQWQAVFGALMIVIVVLAGFSYVQFTSVNDLSAKQEQLQNDFDKLSSDHERLLSWGISTDSVVNFLQDVIQLDMTKYNAELERHTVGYREDLGGTVEEYLTYRLTSFENELSIDFRFRNQVLSRYYLTVIEGSPIYSVPQSTNLVEFSQGLLQRYQNYAGGSYLDEMRNMLASVTQVENTEKIEDDLKLSITTEGNDAEIRWAKTTNGIDYQAKGVILTFDDGILESLTDGWLLFNVGSTEVNISEQEAIQLALQHAKEYSWIAEGMEITDFVVIEQPVSVNLWPHIRDEPLDLIPYWYVVFKLDKVYPGNVNSIGVGLWADTGKVSGYQTSYIG
ncbi:MAG: winged helix-turn-helix domain-containing protein [Candidatus Bathyarchaeota archaeon]|nr:winged helix-turn-helix domain-containing protein [Candidatus Bathyarchaeota archaeon]